MSGKPIFKSKKQGNAPIRNKRKINPKNLKTKKKVKNFIKNKYGPAVQSMTKAELIHLKTVTKHAIKKEAFREKQREVFKKMGVVSIRSVTQPGVYSYQFDSDTLLLYIQTLIDYMSPIYTVFNKSSGVTPADMKMYLFSLAVMYLTKVGSVTGANVVRIPQPFTLNVPQSFYKYLQYIAPYCHNGITQTMVYEYANDFVSVTDASGSADGMLYGPYNDPNQLPTPYNYQGFPMTMVLPQTTVPAPTAASATVPVGQTFFQSTPNPTGINFSDWMANNANLTRVSAVLRNTEVPCKDFMTLSGLNGKKPFAPDGSAYGVKAGDPIPAGGATDTSSTYGGVLNIHENYDVETWYLTGLFRSNTTVPSIIMKPIVPAFFDANRAYGGAKPVPWYCQVFYTAHFLCDNCDSFGNGPYKSLTLNKAHLTTLFPNGRVVTPFDFIALIWEAYRQIQIHQSQTLYTQQNSPTPPYTPISSTGGRANETKTMTNWTVLLSVAMMALQRRINMQQVLPTNSPIIQYMNGPEVGTLMPQYMWVDQSVAEAKLPKTITRAIDALGVIIKNGRLNVPVSLYAPGNVWLAYPLLPAQITGPVGASAYGYPKDPLNTFPLPNLMTWNIGPAPSTAVVPANLTLGTLNINPAYAQTYTGYDIATTSLYPIHLTGSYVQLWHEALGLFLMSGNLVNTIEKCLAELRYPKMGSVSALGTETTVDITTYKTDSVVPVGLAIDGSSSVTLSQLVIVRLPLNSVSSPMLMSPTRAIEALINGWCMVLTQTASQPNTTVAWPNSVIFAALNQSVPPSITQPVVTGAYNAVTIAGGSLNGVISKLTQNIISPDADFGKAKAKLASVMTGVGNVVPRNMKAALQRISDDPAYDTELLKIEKSVFGQSGWRNVVSVHSMGRNGKGMPPEVAQNYAAIDSHCDVTSDDNVPEANMSTTPKIMSLKCDGHRLKKVGNVCKAMGDATMKGLDAVTKVAAGIGSTAAVIGQLCP